MMAEDKEFSFLLRDRLTKYCDDNSIDLSHESPKHKMLLDMIVYCSMGDEEQGLENVRETNNFLQAFKLNPAAGSAIKPDLHDNSPVHCVQQRFLDLRQIVGETQQEHAPLSSVHQTHDSFEMNYVKKLRVLPLAICASLFLSL